MIYALMLICSLFCCGLAEAATLIDDFSSYSNSTDLALSFRSEESAEAGVCDNPRVIRSFELDKDEMNNAYMLVYLPDLFDSFRNYQRVYDPFVCYK